MAHTLRTQVMTPTGVKALVDMKPGDTILDYAGQFQQVKAIRDEGVKEVYVLTTSDGYTVEATADQSISPAVPVGADVTAEAARVALTEMDVLLPPIVDPINLAQDENPELFHPYLLGLMLQDPAPLRGYVSITPDPLDLYTKLLPVPNFVSKQSSEDYRMVYSEESLRDYPDIHRCLSSANLFTGNTVQFRIPQAYKLGTIQERLALLRSFLPPEKVAGTELVSEDFENLPFGHEGYGRDLNTVALSMGWFRTPLRKYSSIQRVFRYEDVRSLSVTSPDGSYLLEGFIAMRDVPSVTQPS